MNYCQGSRIAGSVCWLLRHLAGEVAFHRPNTSSKAAWVERQMTRGDER